jgi:hypothetical protein
MTLGKEIAFLDMLCGGIESSNSFSNIFDDIVC